MRTSDIIQLAWGLVCPAVFGAILSYLVGLFVFGPLHARAVWKAPQTSFRIADIIILLAQLQLVGGLLFAIFPYIERISDAARVGILLGMWILMSVWWWTGVRMLAKAKVEYVWHRWLFLGLFVPLGYAATLGLIAIPFTALISLAMLIAFISTFNVATFSDLIPLLIMLGAAAVTIAAIAATRAFCRKIANRAKDDFALREGVAMGPLVEGGKLQRVREPVPLASEGDIKFVDDP